MIFVFTGHELCPCKSIPKTSSAGGPVGVDRLVAMVSRDSLLRSHLPYPPPPSVHRNDAGLGDSNVLLRL